MVAKREPANNIKGWPGGHYRMAGNSGREEYQSGSLGLQLTPMITHAHSPPNSEDKLVIVIADRVSRRVLYYVY